MSSIPFLTFDLLTYTGGLSVIQLVAMVTDAGVALCCVVAEALATDMRVHLALVHL